jgi:hypothetical protein
LSQQYWNLECLEVPLLFPAAKHSSPVSSAVTVTPSATPLWSLQLALMLRAHWWGSEGELIHYHVHVCITTSLADPQSNFHPHNNCHFGILERKKPVHTLHRTFIQNFFSVYQFRGAGTPITQFREAFRERIPSQLSCWR